ncbi:UDP-N-acetylglucosamine 1-carboxyvinyltransferase [Mobilisporobacter senegalensis]|uniref:UDP-N-acetylglucosamine 1-carboxyvinyltransferase n=1 Tax=Mobilisporobacter senegalensis TaxID=1329262 RepID=A0A3N1XVW2_9FIRM|nr:UDP-N-acetylglucosamine 1-carboxyvinyltransferase [Mobilisporobacter senegalensis]ROR30743.1 UDP-N-acetylglucosamine 1-carboxyvinyltransferase [Mobilisporobacter senegalensis]
MSRIEVIGGKQLHGELNIHGSKNAILPILAATVLNRGVCKMNNCPYILDVLHMNKILESIGCIVTMEGNSIIVDAKNILKTEVSDEYVRQMRSSIILLGALLGREKSVTISFPGGCSIGARPIDLHLKALRKLNVEIKEEDGLLYCNTTKVIGNDIVLDFPSVGATENIILASVISEGTTKIIGAAKEPEIMELCNFLNAMGAKIYGAGTDSITIEGVEEVHDVEYTLVADRIVAGTYMAALAGRGGKITLKGASCRELYSVVMTLIDMGCGIYCGSDYITISSMERPNAIDIIRTSPYPGFPTDMQSQIMVTLSIAQGTSIIIENIFEARYKNVSELIKMGANIIVEGKLAVVKGVPMLHGAEVFASDLRGGAALVIAGIIAEGRTIVDNTSYISRGYEDIVRDFKEIGADIKYLD